MGKWYSATLGGFLDDAVHRDCPADAVPVTDVEHAALLAAQRAGKEIRPDDDGRPCPRTPRVETEALRARLIVRTKNEAFRRIEAVAPIWRQMNAMADLARATAAGTEAAPAIWAMRDRIDDIRTASDALEATIATATARRLVKIDPTADPHWPAQETSA